MKDLTVPLAVVDAKISMDESSGQLRQDVKRLRRDNEAEKDHLSEN